MSPVMNRLVFRGLLAVYGALLLGPLFALVTGPTWPLFGAGALVGGVLGAAASARVDPESLLTVSRVVAGFALPFVWVVPIVERVDSIPGLFLSPWFGGLLGAVVWLLAFALASTIRRERRLESVTEHLVFEARPPADTRRQQRVAAGVILAITVGVGVLTFVLDSDASPSQYVWVFGMLPVWVALLTIQQAREVAITDGGLRIQQSIHGWDSIAGYELTEDALRFTREKWYHSAFEFDRADIDDEAALRTAIERYLDPT